MGNLHFSNILLLLFFFQFFCVQLNTSAYTVPDQYFINCGSSGSTTVNARNFVGDVNPNSFTLSAAHSSIATDPSMNSSSSSFYGTARIFSQASWYELNIIQNGTYVVRFHFYAFTSQAQGIDLYSARFNVSASKFYLLSDFYVQKNSTGNSDSPLIKEFLLNITAGKFKINFTPSGSSSMAFVNAIETFLTPDGLIPDSAPHVNPAGSSDNSYDGLLSNALQLIYRINVGGGKVTPDGDTLGRTWFPDDEYMYFPDAAVSAPVRTQPPLYESGWATKFDAPDIVYNTAKVLKINSSQENDFVSPIIQNFNASWRFSVNQKSTFLVRAHFCDIISHVATDILKFNLFINNFSGLVNPHYSIPNLAVPFYFDFVVDSDDSGLLKISIGPRQDSDNKTAFLNGLEIMELISNSSSISGGNEASKKRLFIIIGPVVGGAVLIIVSVVLLWSCSRVRRGEPVKSLDDWQLLNLNRRSSYSRSAERNVNGSPLPDLNLGLKMALGEVLYATRNFNGDLVIGEGGFGKVYRGTLRDGTKVAVKRSEPGRSQGLPEFQTEIMVLSKIRHRHLVSLIGYCDERSEMVLVYEFMEKGTLRDHLYSSKEESGETTSATSRLCWEKRLELCIDAAKGLHYLHTGLGGAIIHRDVKSTNILLDEHYVAKVADFGISRLGALDQSHVSTEVKGSFGYLDPEYFKCLLLTQKSDVYSFGVVLLEVLCARPAIDNLLPKAQVNLADWGMSCIETGELEKIVDPFLVGKINPDSLRRFGQIVQKCLQECGADRPNMVDLLWELQYALQLQQTAPPMHPHEFSNSDVSYNLPLPVVSRLPSYSIAITEDEMDQDTRINESSTNASEVFSQIIVQEAR